MTMTISTTTQSQSRAPTATAADNTITLRCAHGVTAMDWKSGNNISPTTRTGHFGASFWRASACRTTKLRHSRRRQRLSAKETTNEPRNIERRGGAAVVLQRMVRCRTTLESNLCGRCKPKAKPHASKRQSSERTHISCHRNSPRYWRTPPARKANYQTRRLGRLLGETPIPACRTQRHLTVILRSDFA